MRYSFLLVLLLAAGCSQSLREAVETAPFGVYEPPLQNSYRCMLGVKHLEARSKVPIIRDPGLQDWGMTDYKIIWIKGGLPSCAELETLAHEIGHLKEPRSGRGFGLTERESQIFADAISYGVVKVLGGYDPKARYVRYMSRYKMDARVMDVYRKEIETAVKELTR